MRVVLASKALVVGAYQRKLEAMARHPDVDLVALVPPSWRSGASVTSLERLHLQGYRLIVSPLAMNGNFHLFFFPQLARVLDEVRPDLLHIDEEPYNLATFLATWQAARRRIPTLFFTWQNLHRRYPPPFAWMEQYVYATAATAVAGTASARDVLRAKGYRGQVSVIPQFGVDPEVFLPSAAGAMPHPFTVGYAGRLVPEKGVALLLEACARLRIESRLLVIGTGPDERSLRARSVELGIERQVEFVGAVPSAHMPAYLQRCDVVALPSLSRSNWIEQFGRILVEAMACAVPVVGSTCGEIPAVVGDAGVIVPEGDVAALSETLDALGRDPARRSALGARGRQRVLDQFTQERIAALTIAHYRQALAV